MTKVKRIIIDYVHSKRPTDPDSVAWYTYWDKWVKDNSNECGWYPMPQLKDVFMAGRHSK